MSIENSNRDRTEKNLFVNLQSVEVDALFEVASTFKKFAVIHAELVQVARKIVTIVADGLVETVVIAQPGEYIVTNPGGEEYVLSAQKFLPRYEHFDGDRYQAVGTIKAFRNHTGSPVTIIAPWGEEQHGDADCFFAQTFGADNSDRYIIETNAFFDTYLPHQEG